MQLRPFSDLLFPHLSCNHPKEFSALVTAETPSSEAGKMGEKGR
jgi:hypothetical protein